MREKGIWGKIEEFRRKVVEERGKNHIGRRVKRR
jgi:hypothetical protein